MNKLEKSKLNIVEQADLFRIFELILIAKFVSPEIFSRASIIYLWKITTFTSTIFVQRWRSWPQFDSFPCPYFSNEHIFQNQFRYCICDDFCIHFVYGWEWNKYSVYRFHSIIFRWRYVTSSELAHLLSRARNSFVI